MSKIMIYAPLSAIGGTIENVWGIGMRVKSIDSSDKDAVEQAKADGWSNKAQDVIEQVEAEKLQAENKVMKGQLSGSIEGAMTKRVKELEEQLSQALTEIAEFEQERTDSNKVIDEKIARIAELEDVVAKNREVFKDANGFIDEKNERIAELEAKLAIYESAKDTNGNGKVDYEEMTNAELQKLLDQRKVEYNKRDGKDALIKAAKDSE